MRTASGGEASYVGDLLLPVGRDDEVVWCRGREDGQGNDFAQEGCLSRKLIDLVRKAQVSRVVDTAIRERRTAHPFLARSDA